MLSNTRIVPNIDSSKNIKINNADELINILCFRFLANITPFIPEELIDQDPFKPFFTNLYKGRRFRDLETYRASGAYGNFYTKVMLALEDFFEEKLEELRGYENENDTESIEGWKQKYKPLLDAIFANQNEALEITADFIKDSTTTKSRSKLKKDIEKKLSISGKAINETTALDVDSWTGAVKKYTSSDVKPLTVTSLHTVREYEYKNNADLPVEYRIGTQGEYHKGLPRVNPLFEAWAKVNAPDTLGADEIFHVYINNLPTTKGKKLETNLTAELHKAEARNPHVAVITLPANRWLLSQDEIKEHAPLSTKDLNSKLAEIISILVNEEKGKEYDFKMSANVRDKLYGRNNQDFNYVLELLKKSFKDTLGVDIDVDVELDEQGKIKKINVDNKDAQISGAQLQAAYFHFIKFEFTNFILETLKPKSFNMTCFDAIDRGGASSAYYNLIKSIELDNPMTEDEFNRALHAAPTMVKGRPMNHQIDMLWNTIDAYVTKNQKTKDIPDWLNEWRYVHAPKESKQYKEPLYVLHRYLFELQDRREERKSFLFISGGIDKTTKMAAAKLLLDVIKSKKPQRSLNENTLTEQQYAALHDGDLGKIYKLCKQKKLLTVLPKGQKKGSAHKYQ
jgi:hypothetical protein